MRKNLFYLVILWLISACSDGTDETGVARHTAIGSTPISQEANLEASREASRETPEPAREANDRASDGASDGASNRAHASSPETAPPYAVVASANPHATRAGEAVLRRGGTAVDAAIAVQSVLTLVEPQSSGLGGGAFMLYYDAGSDRLLAYNGREKTPLSGHPGLFLDTETQEPLPFYDAVTSGLAVGVPGVVAMLDMAHRAYGALPWKDLFNEAVTLSRDGFAISPLLHEAVARYPRLKDHPTTGAYLYDAAGDPLPAGHLLKNETFAKTLEDLAENGARAFYEGKIADQIIAAVNAQTGAETMTRQDFLDYTAEPMIPICGALWGQKICSAPPPSSGGVTVLQILGLLAHTDIAQHAPDSWQAVHLLTEASRLAYADRGLYLADPETMKVLNDGLDPTQLINGLTHPDYIKQRARLIRPDSSQIDVAPGNPRPYIEGLAEEPQDADTTRQGLAPDASPEPPATSHFSIMDFDGNVVSMTTSVEFGFGSHMMAAGMILNNQLTDFSFLPEKDGKPIANAPAAGKRPRSSMSPTIIFDQSGQIKAALGSPGGPAIIGFVAKTILGVLAWDLPLQEAIELPNIVIPRGRTIMMEEGSLASETVLQLEALGHSHKERRLNSGVYGFIVTKDGIIPGADKRREGTVRIFTRDETR